jgi:nitroreductase
MDTCIDLLAQPAVASPPQRRFEERRLGPDVRLEVAMVLTQMALSAHGQGVTTC